MAVKAIEDCLNVVKFAAVAIIQAAGADGFQWTDLGAFLKSDEFQTALSAAVPEATEALAEAVSLGLMDDLELARYCYNFAVDIAAALKALPKPVVAAAVPAAV